MHISTALSKPAVLLNGLSHERRDPSKQLRQPSGMKRFRLKYKSARKEMGAIDHWQDVRGGVAVSAQLAGRIKLLSHAVRENKLQSLSLSGETIGDAGARMLGAAIENSAALRSLAMSNVGIGAGGARVLAPAVASCSALTSLDLSHNRRVGAQGALAIAQAFAPQECSKSKVVARSAGSGTKGAGVTDGGGASAGAGDFSLTALSLSHCNVRDAGARALASLLSAAAVPLVELDLGSSGVGDAGAKALAQAMRANSTHRVLRLAGNRIGDLGVSALAMALEACALERASERGGVDRGRGLGTLDLTLNRVSDLGTCRLLSALSGNSELHTLLLSSNLIGSGIGGQPLEATLVHNSTLTLLDLSNNCVGDDEACGLFDALQRCSGLVTLNLSNNCLGEESAAVLASAAPKMLRLRELDLRGNMLRDNGAWLFGASLARCLRLRVLDLGANDIGDAGAWSLANYLTQDNSLTTLNMSSNCITSLGAQLIASLLSSSRIHICLKANPIGAIGVRALTTDANHNVALERFV